MDEDHEGILAIAEQAAEWLILLPTASAQEGEEFLAWLKQSPLHAREFFLALRTEARLCRLDPQHQINVHAYIEKARNSIVSLASIQTAESETAS